MKTTRSTIACAALFAAISLLSSCGVAPLGEIRRGEGGTVSFVIPVFNPKVFGARLGVAGAGARAYIIASSAEVEIWDPSELQSFGTYAFDPADPAIINGGASENLLTLVTGIVLSAGDYLAKVRVYNGLNDDPVTTDVDEGAVPVVYGQKLFTVGYQLDSTVTVTCLPYAPADLAEDTISGEVDLPNALIFADDGPPTTMGSETWFRIHPTTDCTKISAENVTETTASPVPVLALFDSAGKMVRTALPTGAGPTVLSFLSDSTTPYYLAAISGAKASDPQAQRADRHFTVSYAARDLAANSDPATLEGYTSPVNGAATETNQDFSLSWTATSDPDGDPLTYRADLSVGSGGPSFEAGIFMTKTTDGDRPDPGVKVGALSPGVYYWRVAALDGIGGVAYGPVWSFTVSAPNSSPYQPTLLSPIGSAASRRPTFEWNQNGGDPDGDSVTYRVQVSTSPSLDVDPVYRDIVDQSSYSLDVDLAYDTRYYWIVIATDEHDASKVSETSTFVTPAAPPVYSQNFDSAADLASSGWVKGLNMTTGTVEVVSDPTASGRGNVLRVYDPNSAVNDPGATVYSPVIAALEYARTTTSQLPATLEYDFYLAGGSRWFALGRTYWEAFIMNNGVGVVQVYSYYNSPNYYTCNLETGKWYRMKISINETPGTVSYYIYDGETVSGSAVSWAYFKEASYDVAHLGGDSSGRLMFGSWFSSSTSGDSSYGHVYFDNVKVFDTLR